MEEKQVKDRKLEDMETRKLEELRKGDIVFMRIPFEENTRDYYNGYHPKEIRGRMYRDRFGDISKSRFVVVIGHEKGNLIYLPLTSRSHAKLDAKYQYTLQDNSMTYKKDPDMKSYVECRTLRSVETKPDQNIIYSGRVCENDMLNIMIKIGKQEVDFGLKRDQRAYISRNKNESFERRLAANGYTLSKDSYEEKIYTGKDNQTVTKSRYGLVWYHVPLSKEEVTNMVAAREARPVDDFAKAVAAMSNKMNRQESEAVK